MKIFLTIFFLTLTTFSGLSLAEESAVRGIIGKQKAIPKATIENYEESMAVADACHAYNYTRIHYDCDCVGMKFLELRLQQGENAQAFWLRQEAKKKCPNTAEVAGLMYSRCLHWAPMQQGEGYDEFCSCYGREFSKIFSRNPEENLLVLEAQMSTAMGKCNINAFNERKQELRAFVEKLKSDGSYEKLFPGALDNQSGQ